LVVGTRILYSSCSACVGGPVIEVINVKKCSLYTLLMATDRKLQKS